MRVLPGEGYYRAGRWGIVPMLLLVLIQGNGCGGDGDRSAEPVNHAPVLAAQEDTAAAVGDTLELWARADDADGDNLVYGLVIELTLKELKEGYFPDARINKNDGHFRFVPASRDIPQRSFMFTAEDDRGGADSACFEVLVSR